ncbi:MAG TPA: DUF3786 domain-containing protein [Sedimentisphaerales bacterium]|nr:DUF3786 domain-containing protein [Sedimentisphaerales bacterium]
MTNEGLWEQLEALEGPATARRADCQYEGEPGRYTIRVLEREYLVDLSARRVASVEDCSEAGFAEELCILAYLINSKDVPVRDRLIPAASLPGGQFFFRGPHKLPTEKLEDAFGDNPERLYQVADEFGVRRREFGDAAIEFYVLPRVPMTIVIWRADEEFAARASILFDETAAEQLPLDALWMAANLTVKALVHAADAPPN